MADAIIDRINPTDLGLLTHLYNSVFRPPMTEDELRRRLRGRHNVLVQVARKGNEAVGFYVGMELRPDVHFAWTCGVTPESRRTGVATQLMHAAEDWARTEGYRILRFECDNDVRPFLQFGIANDYDIVGIRWDSERMHNVVIFEKNLVDTD